MGFAVLGVESTWSAWVYVAAEWLIRLGMIAAVLPKKRPNVALAWVAVVLFHPLAALLLYLLIGTVRVERGHARRYAELRGRRRAEPFDESAAASVDPRHRDLLRLSESLNLLPPTAGNRVELVGEHTGFIDGVVADIDRAQREARLLYYIFWDDESGRKVGEALMRAAARGVKCLLLADAAGSRSMFGGLGSRLREAGVEVRAALPVKPWRALLVRTDLRNHRKLAVIDGRVAWTGSHNLCNAEYGGSRYGPWIDVSARITGPAAGQLAGVFAEDWYAETGEMLEGGAEGGPPAPTEGGLEARPPREEGAVIQVFRSGPAGMADTLEPFLVGAMHEAEERIVITSPYLIPTQPLMLELRVAVLRGVRVDLIVPEASNHPVAHAAGRAFFDELLEDGVRVHLHRPGLLHSKTMLVDGSFALVGTANFDVRSISLNFELNLLIFGARAVADLARYQAEYLARSRELTGAEWRRRGWARRLGEDTARLFSPLL